jgi:hypothetical protein
MTKYSTVAVLLVSLSAVSALASADIALTVREETPFQYVFTIQNLGPEDVAQNVALVVDAPPSLTIRSTTYDPLQCNDDARPVRCFMSTLPRGPVVEFGFVVQGPSPEVDATYEITAHVESGTDDPFSPNNSVVVQYVTRSMTAFYERVEPAMARVDPGATQTFQTRLDNFRDSVPADIHIRYSATNAVIEKIEPADSRWSCSVTGAEGECVAASLDAGCRCSGGYILVTLRASGDRAGGTATLTMHATSNLPEEYAELDGEATLQTYRILAVNTTADAGPGSLRGAIEEANASCTPGPCKIAFEVPPPVPAEGWFTLIPTTELPPMTAERIALDGTTQTRLTGDTNSRGPEIYIDGHLAWRGLELRAGCEAIVQGLAIGYFGGGDGLLISSDQRDCGSGPPDRRLVSGNYIGVDPTGTVARPNQRGLNIEGYAEVRGNVISRNKWSGIWLWRGFAYIAGDTIEDNGRSGVVLGPESESVRVLDNVINRQAEMGVAVAPGAKLYEIRGNSMADNGGLGIDINIDGVSPVDDDDEYPAESNAPVLLSAVYDPATDRTVVHFVLHSDRLGPYVNSTILDVYANSGPDGDGEQRVSWIQTPIERDKELTLELYGNYKGKWLNATSTRTHTNWAKPPDDKRVSSQSFSGEGYSTSELSNSVLVQ